MAGRVCAECFVVICMHYEPVQDSTRNARAAKVASCSTPCQWGRASPCVACRWRWPRRSCLSSSRRMMAFHARTAGVRHGAQGGLLGPHHWQVSQCGAKMPAAHRTRTGCTCDIQHYKTSKGDFSNIPWPTKGHHLWNKARVGPCPDAEV